MRVAEFLREDLVLGDLAATDKTAALAELCAGVSRVHTLLPQGRLLEVLLEREKLGSTGIGEGVAIPHGKLAGVPGVIAAFGRSRPGIDFAAIDGKPAQLLFLLFAPENSAGLHLKALARISRLLRSQPFRQAILGAPDRVAIHRLIADEDARD
ncbi:MAG: PTS sugar transporter subunit IIA [Myxococcales bacterium]